MGGFLMWYVLFWMVIIQIYTDTQLSRLLLKVENLQPVHFIYYKLYFSIKRKKGRKEKKQQIKNKHKADHAIL